MWGEPSHRESISMLSQNTIFLLLASLEVKQLPPKGYSNVSLPDELFSTIRRFVTKPDSIYSGTTEFIRDAVREKLHILQQTSATQ